MSILDLMCKDSVSFSKNRCNTRINNTILHLGGHHNYLSCLYFDFPPYSCLKNLKNAKLILFKLPMSQYKTFDSRCGSHRVYRHHYIVSPLLEFFSVYSYLYSVPKADYSKKMTFDDDVSLCYTEIDITGIVKEWIDDSMENRGLMLIGNHSNKLISYASEKNDIPRMCPIIRLIYKENTCWGLSSTPCLVEVKN
ncbi:MAG TPA: hypothetical protein VFC73_06835 [Syntrophomonadaceae bacterium]|nr:hypothetical protein [Syntrophomonadaceae bacterium]